MKVYTFNIQTFKICTKLRIFNEHNLSKKKIYIYIYIYSVYFTYTIFQKIYTILYTIFKICKWICIFTIYNFLNNIPNFVHLTYKIIKNVHCGRTRTWGQVQMKEVQCQKSRPRKALTASPWDWCKQLIASTRRLQCPRTSRILLCPWMGRGPTLKSIAINRGRARRFVSKQRREEGRKSIHHLSIHHLRIQCSKPI